MGRKYRIAPESPEQVAIFETWYASGKNFEKARESLLAQDPPITLSYSTLYRYGEKFQWDVRALERDKVVAEKLKIEAIALQEAFLKRQIASGRLLQSKGLTYLNDDKIDPNDRTKGKGGIKSDFAAIQAVRLGLDLERVGMNMPDHTVGLVGGAGGDVIIRVVRELKVVKKRVPKEDLTDSSEA